MIVELILCILIGFMFFLTSLTAYKSQRFIIGKQYAYSLAKIKRINTTRKSKLIREKEIAKIQARKRRLEDFDNLMRRLGLTYNYNQVYGNLQIKTLYTACAFVFPMMVGVLIDLSGIELSLSSSFLIKLIQLGLFMYFIYIAIKPTLTVYLLSKKLEMDTLRETSILISIYKNAPYNYDLYSMLEDFTNNSNALKDDIVITLSEMGVFQTKEALLRLSKRVKNNILDRFISQLIVIMDGKNIDKTSILTIIEKEALETIKFKEKKNRTSRLRVLTFIMVIIFAILAFGMFSESLTEIFKIMVDTQIFG